MEILIHSQYEDDSLIYNHATKENQGKADYSPHFHDICEIIFLKSGDISYIVEGRKYKLKKNMLVFAMPTHRHCVYVDGDSKYERYNILYDQDNLPFNIFEKIPGDVNVFDFSNNKNVINLFDKMDYYCKKLSGNDLKRVLTNLIEELFYNIIIHTDNQVDDDYTQINTMVSRAVKYIDENLTTLKSLDDVCNELYITRSHLHHLFLKYLNITPKKYIIAKRLALAKSEIHSGAKATEVCIKCGFSDYSSFFRAYKNHFKHSPSEISTISVINEEATPKKSATDIKRRYND